MDNPTNSGRGTPDRDQLPLPDYDHLPTGALAQRIRSLDAAGLSDLIGYERAHANRLPVMQVLEARLEAVRQGAPLSSGDPTSPGPEAPAPPEAAETVSPATSGPVINPPSQGVPTNPSQPRSTG